MKRNTSIVTAITASMWVTACMSGSMTNSSSSSTPTPTSPPTEQDYDDTAQAIAASTATQNGGTIGGGDRIAIADALDLARGRLPLGFLRDSDHHFHGNRMGVDNT